MTQHVYGMELEEQDGKLVRSPSWCYLPKDPSHYGPVKPDAYPVIKCQDGTLVDLMADIEAGEQFKTEKVMALLELMQRCLATPYTQTEKGLSLYQIPAPLAEWMSHVLSDMLDLNEPLNRNRLWACFDLNVETRGRTKQPETEAKLAMAYIHALALMHYEKGNTREVAYRLSGEVYGYEDLKGSLKPFLKQNPWTLIRTIYADTFLENLFFTRKQIIQLGIEPPSFIFDDALKVNVKQSLSGLFEDLIQCHEQHKPLTLKHWDRFKSGFRNQVTNWLVKEKKIMLK